MNKVDVKALLEAGVHFGHRTEKWNPKMKPYIFGARNGIYVIDLSHSAQQLEKASEFLKNIAAKGGKILFAGCKKQAKDTIKDLAEKNGAFYVTERWLGGTLTNLKTIRKSVAKLEHIDHLEKSGKVNEMPKKEVAKLRREGQKLHRNLDGIRTLTEPPAVLIAVDTTWEEIAIQEARKLKIPVIAITDTNADPDLIDYPIAGNDDSIRSIKIILEYLHAAVIEGRQEGAKRGSKPAEDKKKEKEEGKPVPA